MDEWDHLIGDSQILAVLCDVLSDEDVVVLKENVQELIYTIQTLFPHVRLKRTQAQKNHDSGTPSFQSKMLNSINNFCDDLQF